MVTLQRVAGLVLLSGAAALLVAVPAGVASGMLGPKEAPWLLLGFTFLTAAVWVYRRLPEQRIAHWFAVVGGAFGLMQALDGVLSILIAAEGRSGTLAAATFAYHLVSIGAVIALANVLGRFPDGEVATAGERGALQALWVLALIPPLALVAHPTILLPTYHVPPVVANPFHLVGSGVLAGAATIGLGLVPAGFVVGVVLIVRRYRRGATEVRRRIRWLLLPALLAGFGAVLESLTLLAAPGAVPRLLVDSVWITALVLLPVTIAIGLLRSDLLDVDRVLRRSLVYGSLWTLITLVYVAAAAALGMAAGHRLDLATAILLTVVATLVFQPARRRLERLADRWVFGARVDPARLVANLGAALAETFDLDTLLPHIEQTLRQGLDLRWVRVDLGAEDRAGPRPPPPTNLEGPASQESEAPVLTVPIVLGAERLGRIHCGPRMSGTPLSGEDERLVVTLARQAALAVRNVKLTAELGERLQQVEEQAEELAHSRSRLVLAQETERRRIERNIHDGVQQDLVALLSDSARIRRQIQRDPAAAARLLEDFQAGLQRAITELRELAHGIHPTLLTDHGLLRAVEALAARSPLPVTVRADPSLRDLRFSEAIEGAGYFTVAEALTNVLKHAAAEHAEVRLERTNGSLAIEVRDDGRGMPRTPPAGDGLANLTARLVALGGRLDVHSNGTGTTVRAVLDVAGSGR